MNPALHRTTNPSRDREIAELYRGGMLLRELAEAYGLALSRISFIVKREGASCSPDELRRRMAASNRSRQRDPEVLAKISATVTRRWAEGRGRPRILADRPEDRALYAKIRRYYGAAYAREQMGIAA